MKVREVLEKIGDEPLAKVLAERGYFVRKMEPPETFEFELAAELEGREHLVFHETRDEEKMVQAVRDAGYSVFENAAEIADGFELYRNRNTEGFRHWLREFFWQQLGRIV